MVDHEVVTAPSASVLAVLRRETARLEPAGKTLFVVADPVYSADDPRVVQRPLGSIAQKAAINRIPSGAETGIERFLRLRFSRTEAEQIADLIPSDGAVKAIDFD